MAERGGPPDHVEGQELEKLKTEAEIESFVRKHCNARRGLNDVINSWLAAGRITASELLKKSRINRNYGYNIVNGKRLNPGRDKILAICIAAELNVRETQETLAISRVGALYARDERDVRIAGALNNRVGDVLKVNIMLAEHGLDPLE